MDELTRDLIEVVVCSAAVAAVSITVAMSKVSVPFRARVGARSPFLGDLVSCPYCLSHWGSLIAVLLLQPRPVQTQWWLFDYLVSIFAMVTMASIWAAVILRVYGGHGKSPRKETALPRSDPSFAMKGKTITKARVMELGKQVSDLRNTLLQEGLFQTSHSMHDVMRVLGYEMEDVLSGKHPTKVRKEKGE